MSRYFDAFSTIQYNGQLARNLLTRSAMSQDLIKNTSVFYPYQSREGERADTLSFLYYKDPTLDWLVYFANDIIDPYYGWCMTPEQFDAYIVDKYGSLALAQLKTHHFEVSWANDDRRLTLSAYDALPAVAPTNVKQYWKPVVDQYGTTVAYDRKPMDLMVSTNKIVTLTMTTTNGFVSGELISQQNGSTVTGYAEIVDITTTTLTIKNIIGSFSTSYVVVGFDTQTQQTPTAVEVVSSTIPEAEQSYWGAVSIYDYEEFLNSKRAGLVLVDNNYAEAAEANHAALMK